MISKFEAQRAALKQKLTSGDMIIGPGIYDGLSARARTVKLAWDPENPNNGRDKSARA